MLKEIEGLFSPQELLRGNFGLERESLRCDKEGHLVYSPHPETFGGKLSNPYITTDFSESQVELITPAFETVEETYKFLNGLYDIAVGEIGEEYFWPQSMPCIIPQDKDIPIATFCPCETGQEAHKYRQKLLSKYGGKKQLVSGIHYNFSFNEAFLEKLYKHVGKDTDYKVFKNQIYLKVARNYLRYRWLIIYLLGSTSVVHESFTKTCVNKLDEVNEESYTNEGALSYRNSECGYTNKVSLFPNYNSIADYIKSVDAFVEQGLIEGPRELYSQIRLKAKDNYNLFESLQKDGILYLEFRSIDINPFEKSGIALEDLQFMHLFNIFLLLKEESDYKKWQEEALQNQNTIARYGQKDIELLRDGKPVGKIVWGLEILEQMKEMNKVLGLNQEAIIEDMILKVKDYTLTYACKIVEAVKTKGYVRSHLDLAREYKEEGYHNRFKLEGYEDMELSTQLLMKEAIKSGIEVKVLDRSENFITLKRGDHVEYVKQATKTSKDNYISVLLMENKELTKTVLNKHGIGVPKGESVNNIEEALYQIKKYEGVPVVIKPKSTNFGLGISIFPDGASIKDLGLALEIGFAHDKTVLIEEYVKGKEYRFLVIGDKVVGVLHRVPANIVGDGIHSIGELVNLKNEDPLRGQGYKTPLEKIQLDESAKLFLKQQGLDFTSIPKSGEIIYLRENSNISTGGDSIDYTDSIPESFKHIAVQAAKVVGANICGVDMMIEDYTNEVSNYAIIELNYNPAIHIHSYPYKGAERNIAKEILALLGYNTKGAC